MRQFKLIEKKESSKLDNIFKTVGKVTAKIPSASAIKNSAGEIAEVTKGSLKSG